VLSSCAVTEHAQRTEAIALDRLIFFSDGVIAIAITLLALDLRLPDTQRITNRDLVVMLGQLLPRYFAFVISFIVIGAYWRAHHRMFRFIQRFDTSLLVRNMVFLFFVVQLPFLTAILGTHGNLFGAVALYAVGMGGMGLSSAWIWSYASRHQLTAGLTPLQAKYIARRALVVPVVFLLSIPVALVWPQIAAVSWFAIMPVQSLMLRGLRGHRV
jgi:uncharacterized membrane protein